MADVVVSQFGYVVYGRYLPATFTDDGSVDEPPKLQVKFPWHDDYVTVITLPGSTPVEALTPTGWRLQEEANGAWILTYSQANAESVYQVRSSNGGITWA